jgi:hypothetical protein
MSDSIFRPGRNMAMNPILRSDKRVALPIGSFGFSIDGICVALDGISDDIDGKTGCRT